MTTMKNIAIILILFLGANTVNAQDYVFRVMLNKGDNQYGTSGNWEDIVPGTKLQEEHSIKVGEGSYIGLVHSSGATIELKEAGEYSVTDLDKKVSGGNSSLIQKYAKYIMDNISDEEHHRLSATGAVERGLFDIDVYLLNYSEYYSDTLIFDWDDKSDVQGYKVKLNDKFDEKILEKETQSSQMMVDFSQPKLKYEELVVVYITVIGDENPKPVGYGIKPMQRDEYAHIKGEFESLKEEVDESTSIGNLVLAGFFEQNSLFPDAVTYYLKAIELSPDVDEYKKVYNDFLLRNGLKKPKNN